MKIRSLSQLALSIVLLITLSGCGTLFVPPTAVPTSSNTALPTSTPEPTSTSTQTETPTEPPTPIVEKDLQPVYIETIAGTYRDVKINLSIVTDKTLGGANPPIDRIFLNPNFTNSQGENAKDALAHYAALSFYNLWLSRQGSNPSIPDADFESYLQAWFLAQQNGDLASWQKVQIKNISANDLNDGNGYKPHKYIIWPMYNRAPLAVPEEVSAINEFAIVFVRANRMKNISMWPGNNYGMGTNLDGTTLYVYMGFVGGENAGGWSITGKLSDSIWWLKTNDIGGGTGADIELYKLLNRSTNPGSCCFRTALKLDPPPRYESIYNP